MFEHRLMPQSPLLYNKLLLKICHYLCRGNHANAPVILDSTSGDTLPDGVYHHSVSTTHAAFTATQIIALRRRLERSPAFMSTQSHTTSLGGAPKPTVIKPGGARGSPQKPRDEGQSERGAAGQRSSWHGGTRIGLSKTDQFHPP